MTLSNVKTKLIRLFIKIVYMGNRMASVMKYKYSAICCARWESRYIGEWLFYCKKIGFDHVYLYCNDDDPKNFFDAVSRTPVEESFYTLKHYEKVGAQRAMYIDALRMAREESEWVSFLDVDEFLALGVFDNLEEFVGYHDENVQCIYFNWLNFRSSGHISRPYGSVLRSYLYRDRDFNPHTKHICKTEILTEDKLKNASFPFHHALSQNCWSDSVIVDAKGNNMRDYVNNFPQESAEILSANKLSDVNNIPHIAHYCMRSAEDLVIRASRSNTLDFTGQDVYLRQLKKRNMDFSLVERGEIYDVSMKDYADSNNLYFDSYQDAPKSLKAKNKFWEGTLCLDVETNSVTLLEQGSTGKFSYHDDIIIIYWDKWPMEIFIKSGEWFIAR